MVTFLSTRAAKSARKHALSISHSLVPNMLFDAPSFGCTSGDLHVSHFAPNQRQCRLTEIHAEKPWWGESSYPKTALQKQWPPKRIEPGVQCGRTQVAVNHLHKAFLLGWQMCAGKHALTLRPQSTLF